jgi:hypothetical protein
LSRLINLTQSDSISLKILAAGNIRFFLTDFPDLEETAIDAIYDLCEDSSSKVHFSVTEIASSVDDSFLIHRSVSRDIAQLLRSQEHGAGGSREILMF